MTPSQVAAKLRVFNDWRRGHHDDTAQPDPREIGEATDAAVEMIERVAASPTRITTEQALNMAINAGEHLRKYLPNDEFLTEADRMAVALLEKAKRFERGE